MHNPDMIPIRDPRIVHILGQKEHTIQKTAVFKEQQA